MVDDTGHLALVRILDAAGTPVGIGVLLGERHVVTAAHNIFDAVGDSDPRGLRVLIDFPLVSPGSHVHAEVAFYEPARPGGASDLCGLRLIDDPPAGVLPAPVVLDSPDPNAPFELYGVPRNRDDGVWLQVLNSGPTAGGRLQVRVAEGAEHGILPGYSGSPLWSPQRRAMSGIILAAEAKLGWRVAYALPAAEIFRLWPELHEASRRRSPYCGLGSFTEKDRPFFFGRDAQSAELADRVARGPVTLLLANPGFGKSSLIRAGAVPRLRDDGWGIAYLDTGVPGLSPAQRIADALVPAAESPGARIAEVASMAEQIEGGNLAVVLAELTRDTGLVLVIDQFEELLARDPDSAARLCEVLLPLAKPGSGGKLRILVSLRTDYLAQATGHLAEDLFAETYFLLPMAPDGLRDAVARPAEATGPSRFAPETVDRIIADAADTTDRVPGTVLPLIEFTATALWEGAKSARITLEDYHKIGGIQGALVNRADSAVAELDSRDRELLPWLLTQLVQVGTEPGRDTRSTVPRSELDDQGWRLVQHLAGTRLVVIQEADDGAQTVRLVHDVLLKHWQVLTDSIREHRDFRRWQGEIEAARRRWRQDDDPGSLLRGGALAIGLIWMARHGERMLADERAFLQASRAAAKTDRRRTFVQRQLWVTLAGLAMALTLVFALIVPEIRTTMADRMVGTAAELRKTDEAAAVIVDAAAQRVRSRPDTVRALLDDMVDNVATAALLPTDLVGRPVGALGDTNRFAMLSAEGLAVWDLGVQPPQRVRLEPTVSAATISDDGKRVAIGDRAGRVTLRDAGSWTVLAHWAGPASTDSKDDSIAALAFDRSGTRLAATASSTSRMRLWDLNQGTARDKTIGSAYSPIGGFSFTTAGNLVVVSTASRLSVWNLAGDAVVPPVTDPSRDVTGNSGLSHGSRAVLWSCRDGDVELVEPDTGVAITDLTPPSSCPDTVTVSGSRALYRLRDIQEDSETPWTEVYDGTMLWTTIRSGDYVLGAHGSLLAAREEETVRVLRIPPEHQVSSAEIRRTCFLSDGSLLVLRSDGTLQRHDKDGRLVASRSTLTNPRGWSIAPDGSSVALIGTNNRESGYRLRRYSLPYLDFIGPEVEVRAPVALATEGLDLTTLSDGRIVVLMDTQLLVYPVSPETSTPRVVTMSGANSVHHPMLWARPGTSQVAVRSPEADGFQLVDVDESRAGPTWGLPTGVSVVGMRFDHDGQAVVLGGGRAFVIDPDTGRLADSDGMPLLAELAPSADAAAIRSGWPELISDWGLDPIDPRIWAPSRRRVWVELSPDATRVAVIRSDQTMKINVTTLLSVEPADWRKSLCGLSVLAHDRARSYLSTPEWLVDPC